MSRSVIRELASLLASFALVIGWSVAGYPLPSAVAATGPNTPSRAEIAATMPPQSDTGWLIEYIVFTMNAEEQTAKMQFEAAFGLTPVEQDSLRAIAAARQDAVRAARGSLTATRGATIQAQAEQSLHTLLGSRYNGAVAWLRDWYAQDMAMRTQQQIQLVNSQKKSAAPANPLSRLFGGAASGSSYTTLEVYQTQFGSSGWDGALPDWDLKFATLGWTCCPTPASPPYNTTQYPSPYSFQLDNLSHSVSFGQVWTKDVGPWNEDDNYWDFSSYSQAINPRRCSPAPGYQNDGIPEAQLALNNGYNGGLSCYLSVSGYYQTVGNIGGG